MDTIVPVVVHSEIVTYVHGPTYSVRRDSLPE